jgi:hypothetical protein
MDELRKKKVPELKDMLRKMKKRVGGKKADLIDRILESSSSSSSSSSSEVIDLRDRFTNKNGKLKLGSLIINIHNNLGGDPGHPYIKKVVKQANAMGDEEEKYEVVDKLEPHIIKSVKKFPPVQTVSKKPVAPEAVSAKAQKMKDKVAGELKEIKKSSGFDPAFKAKLASIFG